MLSTILSKLIELFVFSDKHNLKMIGRILNNFVRKSNVNSIRPDRYFRIISASSTHLPNSVSCLIVFTILHNFI